MGIRLIIYLDEILITSETKELAQIHIAITVNLLSSLGFVINEDKSLYEPTQELEFLGFLVNSVTMCLYLPKDKSVDPEGLPKTHRQPYVVSKSFVSSSGKAFILNSSGIPSPLHYRFLMRAKNVALKRTQSYDESTLSLDQGAQQELLWWRDHLAACNGRCLLGSKEDLVIATDASNLGWGASCNGIRTGRI